jgi:hypothetical protein
VTFLPVLGLVDRVLDTHPASPQRFGALNMLSALAPFAMRHPDVKHKMEDFTMKYVFTEFSSPEGYMRAVVWSFLLTCWGLCCSKNTQANEVVAAEVRNHIVWANQEVRHHSCLSVWSSP